MYKLLILCADTTRAFANTSSGEYHIHVLGDRLDGAVLYGGTDTLILVELGSSLFDPRSHASAVLAARLPPLASAACF